MASTCGSAGASSSRKTVDYGISNSPTPSSWFGLILATDVSRRKRTRQFSKSPSLRSRRRVLIGVLGVLAVLVMLLFGRGFLGWWAREMAGRRMDAWAISAAQEWLARSAWLDPGHAETDLMQAACFRYLAQADLWAQAVRSAELHGASAERIRYESRLGLIQAGEIDAYNETELTAAAETGMSLNAVSTALVYGHLEREEAGRARGLLEAWRTSQPHDAHAAYMWGVYWLRMEEKALAKDEFEQALSAQADHEMARAALAALFEDFERLDAALDQYVELATRAPNRQSAKIGLARVLRKLARVDDAKRILQPLTAQPDPVPDAAIEMGHIELDTGNHGKAARWYAQTNAARTDDQETLSALAILCSFEGQTTCAEGLIERIDAQLSRSTRTDDLEARLAIEPDNRQAADELKRLSQTSTESPEGVDAFLKDLAAPDGRAGNAMTGAELYALHCGPCHGPNGNGNGRAARHLFPKPRDLRNGSYRLVSTQNRVPTVKDLESVIQRGMPGTSMRSFEDFNRTQLDALVRELLRLRRDGLRDQYMAVLEAEGEEAGEDEIREFVKHRTTPGDVIEVPKFDSADAQTLARGKALYQQQTCDSCHGGDGVGAWDVTLFDEKQRPSRPRDLVKEPFKGGHEPSSIYLRIVLGMPGTPHPSSQDLTEDQMVDLVHYCRSLGSGSKRMLTSHQQAMQQTAPAYLTAIGRTPTP